MLFASCNVLTQTDCTIWGMDSMGLKTLTQLGKSKVAAREARPIFFPPVGCVGLPKVDSQFARFGGQPHRTSQRAVPPRTKSGRRWPRGSPARQRRGSPPGPGQGPPASLQGPWTPQGLQQAAFGLISNTKPTCVHSVWCAVMAGS